MWGSGLSCWVAQSWTTACQASLSFTISPSLLKLMSIESAMPSNHLTLWNSLLLPSIFPSTEVFSSESVLHIRRPKYWNFSFSKSPSNECSRLTGLISLLSKGLSRVFSSTTVWKHQFFGAQSSLWSISHNERTTFFFLLFAFINFGECNLFLFCFNHISTVWKIPVRWSPVQ